MIYVFLSDTAFIVSSDVGVSLIGTTIVRERLSHRMSGSSQEDIVLGE